LPPLSLIIFPFIPLSAIEPLLPPPLPDCLIVISISPLITSFHAAITNIRHHFATTTPFQLRRHFASRDTIIFAAAD